jgi:hypothetical protein
MAHLVRIDTHAHLYDAYSVRAWCYAAFRNLGGGPEVTPVVFVVDRDGQDSLARLRREVPSFAEWQDLWDGRAGAVRLGGGSLFIVQGVQYVTSERIEVLGFGVERVCPDGSPASEYISRIEELDGLACLPWSPGKWLGSRGEVVRTLLDTKPVATLLAGDISMRSRVGPPSSLLSYARRKGVVILFGTDPLPGTRDEELVGSFGVEVALACSPEKVLSSWSALKDAILLPGSRTTWGSRNSPARAALRFFSSLIR